MSNKLQREQWRKWHWKYIKLISGNTRIEIKISPRCSYSLSFRALCNKLFPLNATKRASRSLFSNFPRCRNALPWYFRKAKKPRLWKQFCHLGMTSFRDKHVQKLRKRPIDAKCKIFTWSRARKDEGRVLWRGWRKTRRHYGNTSSRGSAWGRTGPTLSILTTTILVHKQFARIHSR